MDFESNSDFRASRGGFTLVEVMVAMTIMAMVVTVAFAGLRIGIDSWDRGSRRVEAAERRMTLEHLLKRQLAVATPYIVRENDQNVVLFQGSEQQLEFVSDYSLEHGQGDFRKIDYVVADGQFLYAEKDLFTYVPGRPNEDPIQSLGNVETVAFRYLRRTSEGESSWMNEWKAEMGMPVAVQVDIDGDVIVIPLVNRP